MRSKKANGEVYMDTGGGGELPPMASSAKCHLAVDMGGGLLEFILCDFIYFPLCQHSQPKRRRDLLRRSLLFVCVVCVVSFCPINQVGNQRTRNMP